MSSVGHSDPVRNSFHLGNEYVTTIHQAWTFKKKALWVCWFLMSVGSWIVLFSSLNLLWGLVLFIFLDFVVSKIKPKVPVYATIRHIPSGAAARGDEVNTNTEATDSAMLKLQATTEFVTWQRDRKEFDAYLDGIDEWLNEKLPIGEESETRLTSNTNIPQALIDRCSYARRRTAQLEIFRYVTVFLLTLIITFIGHKIPTFLRPATICGLVASIIFWQLVERRIRNINQDVDGDSTELLRIIVERDRQRLKGSPQ